MKSQFLTYAQWRKNLPCAIAFLPCRPALPKVIYWHYHTNSILLI